MTDETVSPIIYIDADACPVKEEVVRVATRYGLKVFIVANGGIRPSRDPMVETVIVGNKFDEADDWIAERAIKADIVITGDVPLAERCVNNGALVTNHHGKMFTPENMGMSRAMRDLSQTLREAGTMQTYNPAFSPKDRSNFLQTLDKLARDAIAARKVN